MVIFFCCRCLACPRLSVPRCLKPSWYILHIFVTPTVKEFRSFDNGTEQTTDIEEYHKAHMCIFCECVHKNSTRKTELKDKKQICSGNLQFISNLYPHINSFQIYFNIEILQMTFFFFFFEMNKNIQCTINYSYFIIIIVLMKIKRAPFIILSNLFHISIDATL